MKKIKVTTTHLVPHWNFCNNDASLLPKAPTCKFFCKDKAGCRCALYDEPLVVTGEMVSKTRRCCSDTVDRAAEVQEHVEPTVNVDPKDLVKSTIELYDKMVKSLRNQGYPQALAEQAARQHILGG